MEYYSTRHIISAYDIRLSVLIVCNRLLGGTIKETKKIDGFLTGSE
jgi:hypothetical protein